jgi:acetoacetate decarboxylase
VPVYGLLDPAALESALPEMPHWNTEAWSLPRAEILQLAWEVSPATRSMLPRAMHPAVPSYVTFHVTRYPESPVGPFVLAQLRLMGRAGAHPRGFVLGAVASTPEAASALRERWGLPAVAGGVTLRRRHDRVMATVMRDGTPILDAALVNPEVISPGDVQYIHSVMLARVTEAGRPVPYLIQVDPHYTLHKAERGRPDVSRFAPAGWNAGSLALDFPIAASITTCDTDLPQIRFVMHPETPVVQGTKRIR